MKPSSDEDVLHAGGQQALDGAAGGQAAHGRELVADEVLDHAGGARADDVDAPAVAGERVGGADGEGEAGVAPQVVVVVASTCSRKRSGWNGSVSGR
jgi:hypothetical protein